MIDVHLVNIHSPILDRDLSFPTTVGALVLQHLSDVAHDDLGVLALGWLHAWLDDTRHTPTTSIRRVVWVHDASPINGVQDGIRKGSLS